VQRLAARSRWRAGHDGGCRPVPTRCGWAGGVGRAVRLVAARRRLGRAVVQARALRVAGSYRPAAKRLNKTIARYEARPEVDPIGLGVALNELGMIGKYSGHFDEAERAYLEALRLFKRCAPGAGSARAASVLHNLGGLAHARGRFVEAAAFARRGIAVRESAGGTGSVQLIDDRAALAAILVDLGHLDEARAALLDVVALRETPTHADPVEVAVALHNLGSLHFRSGLVTEARQTLERTLALKQKTLAPGHPDLAITLHNLACCLAQLGEPEAAAHHFQRGVDVLAPVAAHDHPTLAALRAKLDSLRGPPTSYPASLPARIVEMERADRSTGTDRPRRMRRFLMKLLHRWTAAMLGVGVLGLLAAVATAADRPGPDTHSTPALAVTSSCQEWMCGTNHNEVLL